MDQEFRQELDMLESNLIQMRNKFLEEWTGETFNKLLKTRKHQVDNCVRQNQENIQDLEKNIQDNLGNITKLQEDKLKKGKEIMTLEKELDMLSLQNEQLSKKKVLREKQLDDAKKYTKQEEQAAKKAKEKTVTKIKQFTKGIKFFQDHLGFTFKKIDDDHLQFVFTYIDPNDHDAPFIFTVKVDENGKYKVKDCSPMINQLTSLTDELNKTNDFSKFVISVRQGFKEFVRKL